MTDRVDEKKADLEVQYCSLLLSEVVSVKGAQACWVGGGCIIPHLKDICEALDRLLMLGRRTHDVGAFTYFTTCEILFILL